MLSFHTACSGFEVFDVKLHNASNGLDIILILSSRICKQWFDLCDVKLHSASSDFWSLMLSFTMQAMIYANNDLDIFWC